MWYLLIIFQPLRSFTSSSFPSLSLPHTSTCQTFLSSLHSRGTQQRRKPWRQRRFLCRKLCSELFLFWTKLSAEQRLLPFSEPGVRPKESATEKMSDQLLTALQSHWKNILHYFRFISTTRRKQRDPLYLDVKVAVVSPDEDDEGSCQVIPRRGLNGFTCIFRPCTDQKALLRWKQTHEGITLKLKSSRLFFSLSVFVINARTENKKAKFWLLIVNTQNQLQHTLLFNTVTEVLLCELKVPTHYDDSINITR